MQYHCMKDCPQGNEDLCCYYCELNAECSTVCDEDESDNRCGYRIALKKDIVEKELCPFCGSTSLKVDSKKSTRTRWVGTKREYCYTVTVRCNKCHCKGPTVSVFVGSCIDPVTLVEDKAIELWNNRVV